MKVGSKRYTSLGASRYKFDIKISGNTGYN
nr:MAG TPA: hypothetical protein [Caudoviricetes sp.]